MEFASDSWIFTKNIYCLTLLLLHAHTQFFQYFGMIVHASCWIKMYFEAHHVREELCTSMVAKGIMLITELEIGEKRCQRHAPLCNGENWSIAYQNEEKKWWLWNEEKRWCLHKEGKRSKKVEGVGGALRRKFRHFKKLVVQKKTMRCKKKQAAKFFLFCLHDWPISCYNTKMWLHHIASFWFIFLLI